MGYIISPKTTDVNIHNMQWPFEPFQGLAYVIVAKSQRHILDRHVYLAGKPFSDDFDKKQRKQV